MVYSFSQIEKQCIFMFVLLFMFGCSHNCYTNLVNIVAIYHRCVAMIYQCHSSTHPSQLSTRTTINLTEQFLCFFMTSTLTKLDNYRLLSKHWYFSNYRNGSLHILILFVFAMFLEQRYLCFYYRRVVN